MTAITGLDTDEERVKSLKKTRLGSSFTWTLLFVMAGCSGVAGHQLTTGDGATAINAAGKGAIGRQKAMALGALTLELRDALGGRAPGEV